MIFRDGGMNFIMYWNQCIILCELLNNCWHFICVTRCYLSLIWWFFKLPRALFMISSNKFLMKWVFCWRCSVSSSTISFDWKGRLFSEVISVVERQKESKFYGVLTLVIIFLSNNWEILTAVQPSSKLVPLVLLIFFVIALISAWFLLFLILCIGGNIRLCKRGGFSLLYFVWLMFGLNG